MSVKGVVGDQFNDQRNALKALIVVQQRPHKLSCPAGGARGKPSRGLARHFPELLLVNDDDGGGVARRRG